MSVFYLNIFVIMYKQFQIEFDKLKINPDTTIYVAISGGVDSIVLSHLLTSIKRKHLLLHCNFNLRGEEANQDESFLKEYASDNNIEIKTTSFNTKLTAQEENLSIQECARNLRYNWFFTFVNNENSILMTAHHLDDSIETFFINILRGTGLKGISGIPNGKNKIYRPLLSFGKKDILDFATDNNILFREDSSNSSDNYLRNNLRHHFIPEFKKLTGDFEQKISTMFTELEETNNFIEDYLSPIKELMISENKILKSSLLKIPQFMWHRLFSILGLSRKHNSELIKLVNSSIGSEFKSTTHRLLNDRDYLIISKTDNINPDFSIIVNENLQDIVVFNHQFKFQKTLNLAFDKHEKNKAFLDLDKVSFPIIIRKWKNGDKIQPLGMIGKKLISDILINHKLNKFDKEAQTVIECGGKIVWLTDLVISNSFSITKNTKNVLKIEHIQY
jgi:tRNA(Ile)-lysidine synthase